jgi:hypothetical protein
MVEGKLHGGPAVLETGNGWRCVFSYMHQGKARGHGKTYLSDGSSRRVDSLEEERQVPGWLKYVGGFDGSKYNEHGKRFNYDGRVFTGEWKSGLMVEGEMSALQEDGSRLLTHCLFDHQAFQGMNRD